MKRIYLPFFCDKDIDEFIKCDAEKRRVSKSLIVREILQKHYANTIKKK